MTFPWRRTKRGTYGGAVKPVVAAWAFINGLLSIILSLTHLHLLGGIRGLYFAGNHAWLAQHGVVVGIILLYLSRHLARGEVRARQIFLVIAALEVIEYALVSPNLPLTALYLLTFSALFVLRDEFDRGVEAATLEIRFKDALYMLGALLLASLVGLLVLLRTNRLSMITSQSIDHFFDYTLRSQVLPRTQVKSALLAHTISVFVVTGIATILWILFRPYKKQAPGGRDRQEVTRLLERYSGSPEDYFKLWPVDKDYFWPPDKSGFIAYKETGPIAFALADPICSAAKQSELIGEFINWARGRRLRACFLPIYGGLQLYQQAGLNSLQIGANAKLEIATFLNETVQDKWWRWQKNRATKSGYEYASAKPPHNAGFIAELKVVSDAWLDKDRQERGFAQGYFNHDYLQQCTIDYLRDASGKIVAFTNRLPLFKPAGVASVDLLRYLPEANNAMPYLLLKTIENINERGDYKYFDLGFAPFAAAKSPVIRVARALTSNRISAKGLERFKNKFKPEWHEVYLAYDGDLGDLALVTANVEKAMRVSD